MTHAASMDTDTEKEETFAEPLLSDQQGTARKRGRSGAAEGDASTARKRGRSMELLQETERRPQEQYVNLSS